MLQCCGLLQLVKIDDMTNRPKTRLIGVTERGHRVGEDNPAAKLTSEDVVKIFELREEGFGYKKLAKIFDISVTAVRKIVHGETWAVMAVRYKRTVIY